MQKHVFLPEDLAIHLFHWFPIKKKNPDSFLINMLMYMHFKNIKCKAPCLVLVPVHILQLQRQQFMWLQYGNTHK